MTDFMSRKIVEIDEDACDGCGQCVSSCAEGAIVIIDGKAKLVADKYCDGLGACLGECPQGALKIITRKADAFDEEAVHKHLSASEKAKLAQPVHAAPVLACGCPSAKLQSLSPLKPFPKHGGQSVQSAQGSMLSNWPVQIRLVPPTAPFLKGANLLVVADCVPVAFPDFHGKMLVDKVVLMGCPKFDDTQSYVEKFAQIFTLADIKSVSVAVMEVPCCQGLPTMVKKAMEMAGKNVPLKKVVVGVKGNVVNDNATVS